MLSPRIRMISNKTYPQGLPLKFQHATFVTMKISRNQCFIGNLTGSELDMTIFDHVGDCLGV